MIATASRHLSATATRRKLVIGLAAATISVAFVTATLVAASTAPIRTAETAAVPGSADHDRVTSPIPASATTLHAERDLHRITSPIPAYATTLHADDSAVVWRGVGRPACALP